MSSELNQLFERTMPPEQVVLQRMNAARSRRARQTQSPFQSGRLWALAGVACVAACVAVAALLTPAPAPALRAEAERLEPALARASAAAPQLEPGSPTALEAPPTGSAVVSAVPKASKRAVASASTTASSAPREPARAPASWEAAARALREGDQAEAQRQLAELSKSSEPEVRDSALLVRLRSALPRLSADERAQLETLARSGATASIRSDARKLLEEVKAAQP